MFRLAVAADLETVKALTEAAYAQYTERLGALPIPVTEDYAPRIARDEVWLLDIDGAIAGLAVVERHEDHLMLFSIAVSPAFQHAGHGQTILRWLEDKAREWRLPEIRLYTNARMERNIALYLAFGFHETGRRAHPYREGWIVVDMAKAVGSAA